MVRSAPRPGAKGEVSFREGVEEQPGRYLIDCSLGGCLLGRASLAVSD